VSGKSLAPRWLAWWVCAVVVIGALTFGLVNNSGPPRDNNARISSIAAKLRCLVCEGESVEDSRAAFAQSLRDEIAREILAGRTDDQIMGKITANNPSDILLLPRAEGINLLLWILPVLAAVVALTGLTLAFTRWRRAMAAHSATDADEALVAALRRGALDE
jgi:cytochrome c-type biogenesis protein CcmH